MAIHFDLFTLCEFTPESFCRGNHHGDFIKYLMVINHFKMIAPTLYNIHCWCNKLPDKKQLEGKE